jgi:hypothetical protein
MELSIYLLYFGNFRMKPLMFIIDCYPSWMFLLEMNYAMTFKLLYTAICFCIMSFASSRDRATPYGLCSINCCNNSSV